MKSKFFLAMTVAAGMLLAACDSPVTPTPSSSEAEPTPTSEVIEDKLTAFTISVPDVEGVPEVEIGEELTIKTAFEGTGDFSRIVDWASSDPAIATVTNGKVKGVASGEVTITATPRANAELAKTMTVKVIEKVVNYLNVADWNGTTSGASADVVVLAKAYNGFVVGDASGAAYVWTQNYTGENADPEVGAHVIIEGEGAAYYGGLEIKPSAISLAEGNAPEAKAAIEMTDALATEIKGLVSTANADKGIFDQTKGGLYEFKNVMIGGSGNKMTWEVGGVKFVTSNTADENKPVADKKYDLTGIIFNSAQTPNDVTVILTHAEESPIAVGEVSLAGDSHELQVNASMNIVATVAGDEAAVVVWSLEGEGAEAIAELTFEGNTATVKGLADGEVTLVATNGDFRAEWALTVVSFVAKKLNQIAMNDAVLIDGNVIAVAYNGFVLADDTGFVYVYTKNYSGENKDVAVGYHVAVKGAIGQFNGALQLVPSEITLPEGTGPNAKEAIAMTEEKGIELVNAVETAKAANTFAEGIMEERYTFEGVTLTASSNYRMWNLGAALFENANTPNGIFTAEMGEGAVVDIEAIPYGIYTKDDNKYLTMVIISISLSENGQSSEELSSDELSSGINDESSEAISGSSEEAVANSDTLNHAFAGVEGTSYADWTKTGASGVIYTGNSGGGNTGKENLQLRSKNNSGIVISGNAEGKIVESIVVTWNTANDNAAGRQLDVYGSATAYSAPSDLYGANAGTLIGSMAYGAEASVTLQMPAEPAYSFIGIRSANGAIYVESIVINFAA